LKVFGCLVYFVFTQCACTVLFIRLFHLLSGTNLKRAAGIVLGVFSECSINGEEPSLTLRVALDDLLKPLGIPVSYGNSFGHIKRMVTIPTGIRAAMDADRNSFRLLEPAVV